MNQKLVILINTAEKVNYCWSRFSTWWQAVRCVGALLICHW